MKKLDVMTTTIKIKSRNDISTIQENITVNVSNVSFIFSYLIYRPMDFNCFTFILPATPSKLHNRHCTGIFWHVCTLPWLHILDTKCH